MGGICVERNNVILEAKGISKSFPGVQALQNVNFRLVSGKVHVLMGENGAGKSTLMKIIAGIYEADEGEVFLHGKKVVFSRPKQALINGIAMIHQELSPILDMSITENLFLGKEIVKNGILDYRQMNERSAELLERVGLNLPPTTLMKRLSTAQQQMVEIAKALSFDSEIIIMDEPTASITSREVEKLFAITRKLKEEGRCIVYISHKMEEIFQIADEITVFRDGCHVGTYHVNEIDEAGLVKLMVDRDLSQIYPKRHNIPREVILEVENLTQEGVIDHVSFQVRRGEILGFAGLMGAGRTETMNAMFGLTGPLEGKIRIENREIDRPTPKKMIEAGIGYVTEDRKGSGLVLDMSVRDNIILASLSKFSRLGKVNFKKANERSNEFKERLKIKTPSMEQLAKNLSGGNQQKIVLAKWLMQNPDIIIFDEPTRGIDVGAKAEIYRLIASLAEEGKAVIFISSEMPEVLGMCDRIVIMSEGVKKGELSRAEATQEKILSMAADVVNEWEGMA